MVADRSTEFGVRLLCVCVVHRVRPLDTHFYVDVCRGLTFNSLPEK